MFSVKSAEIPLPRTGIRRAAHGAARKDTDVLPAVNKDSVHRVHRIAGEISGIKRMDDEEPYCVELLTQIAAVRFALDQLGARSLPGHLESCVLSAARACARGVPGQSPNRGGTAFLVSGPRYSLYRYTPEVYILEWQWVPAAGAYLKGKW